MHHPVLCGGAAGMVAWGGVIRGPDHTSDARTHAHTLIQTHMHAYTRKQIHKRERTCTHPHHIKAETRLHTDTYAHIYHTQTCMQTHKHICTQTHHHIKTHTHAHHLSLSSVSGAPSSASALSLKTSNISSPTTCLLKPLESFPPPHGSSAAHTQSCLLAGNR